MIMETTIAKSGKGLDLEYSKDRGKMNLSLLPSERLWGSNTEIFLYGLELQFVEAEAVRSKKREMN